MLNKAIRVRKRKYHINKVTCVNINTKINNTQIILEVCVYIHKNKKKEKQNLMTLMVK